MGKIYDAIKSAVSEKMVKSAAAALNENEKNVSSAINVLVPSHLAALLKESANKNIASIAKDAGNFKVFSKKEQLFEGSGIFNGINIGERFENALIGTQNTGFPKLIAKESGVSHESADRLSNWVAGLIAGYFGDRMSKDKISMGTLLNELRGEHADIMKDVPDGIADELKLSACNIGEEDNHPTCNPKANKNNNWIWWILLLIAVIAAIIILMRSCNHRKEVKAANEEIKIENADRVPQANAQMNTAGDREKTEVTLNNGRKITIFRGSAEEHMLDYLKSGKYKNASARDLASVWYHFDGIDFVFDSSNELLPESMSQLENLAEILKDYPEAKIKIGGYADNKGGKAVNNEISEQRANYIKSVFVKNGIDAKRVSTEGFGKEFATVPANASDAARAIDRSIALRFDK